MLLASGRTIRYRLSISVLMNCVGFALGTFDVLGFCTDYSDILELGQPISARFLSEFKMNQFIRRHGELGLRLISCPLDCTPREDLVLFRLKTYAEEPSEYLENLYLSYDCHFIRRYADMYWWTYYGRSTIYCRDTEPDWGEYDGPILYLAVLRTLDFELFLKCLA